MSFENGRSSHLHSQAREACAKCTREHLKRLTAGYEIAAIETGSGEEGAGFVRRQIHGASGAELFTDITAECCNAILVTKCKCMDRAEVPMIENFVASEYGDTASRHAVHLAPIRLGLAQAHT